MAKRAKVRAGGDSSSGRRAAALALAAAVGLASACSPEGASAPGGSREAEGRVDAGSERTVTPEVARAAAALSLSGIGSLKEGSDYARAVNCAAALAALDEVIQLGALGEAEAKAVREAADHFRRRAGELRGQEGKTEQQFAEELEREQAELAVDPGSAGQTALACLRALAV